jgi:hypothetical protein
MRQGKELPFNVTTGRYEPSGGGAGTTVSAEGAAAFVICAARLDG